MSFSRLVSTTRAALLRGGTLVMACAGFFLSGCNTPGGSSNAAGHYQVRVATPIFRYGPAQSFGPDFKLQPGQHVVMLSKQFGYSRIMTDDGQSGYVATEDLVPAQPPVPPKQTASAGGFTRVPYLPSRGTARPGVSSANNRVIDTGPLFGGGELPPLPDKDPLQSAGQSKPGFRVNVPTPQQQSKPGFRVKVPER